MEAYCSARFAMVRRFRNYEGYCFRLLIITSQRAPFEETLKHMPLKTNKFQVLKREAFDAMHSCMSGSWSTPASRRRCESTRLQSGTCDRRACSAHSQVRLPLYFCASNHDCVYGGLDLRIEVIIAAVHHFWNLGLVHMSCNVCTAVQCSPGSCACD